MFFKHVPLRVLDVHLEDVYDSVSVPQPTHDVVEGEVRVGEPAAGVCHDLPLQSPAQSDLKESNAEGKIGGSMTMCS